MSRIPASMDEADGALPIEVEEADDPAMRAFFRQPTAEELFERCSAAYARCGPTFIDQWPEHLRELSFPTKLVPVEASLMRRLWDDSEDGAREELAALLDAEMGWQQWFVRLNSRSPKDASYPQAPVTCSGKQAVWWIAGSERCLDDTSMFYHARQPMFICLREWAHMVPDGEFRAFAKGGVVLGVSRYFYDQVSDYTPDPGELLRAVTSFYAAHLAGEYPDVVFDLYMPGGSMERLIEINPYGLSDPCLFQSYAEIENVGGVRLQPATAEPERVTV